MAKRSIFEGYKFDEDDEGFIPAYDLPGSNGRKQKLPEQPALDFAGDPLWEDYKIKPTLPLKEKIEILVVRYRKNEDEVADILDIDIDIAISHIEIIENNLRGLGKPLTEVDKELERGRMIRQYQKLIAELEEELSINRDPRLLTSKLQAQKELKELCNLQPDKKEINTDESEKDAFDKAINSLSADKLKRLHELLK